MVQCAAAVSRLHRRAARVALNGALGGSSATSRALPGPAAGDVGRGIYIGQRHYRRIVGAVGHEHPARGDNRMGQKGSVDENGGHPPSVVEAQAGGRRSREQHPQHDSYAITASAPSSISSAHDISAAARNPLNPSVSACSMASLNTRIVCSGSKPPRTV